MSTSDRRKVRADRGHDGGRRRGPMILRFEPLEGRALLTAAARPADLAVVSLQTESNRDWGDPVRIQGTIQNGGGTEVENAFRVDVYVSPSRMLGDQSVKIGSFTVDDDVKPGERLAIDETVDLPGSAIAGIGADQAIYIGLVVDAENRVAESNETNNYNRGLGTDTALILVTPRAPAQIVAKSFTVDELTPNWGEDLTIGLRLENIDGGPAPATRARIVLTPAGATPGGTQDVTIADDIEVPAMGGFSSIELTKEITLPPGPPTGSPSTGRAVLWVDTDADFETNPLNNPVLLRQGGVDFAEVMISPEGSTGTATPATAPDVAASGVLTPGTPLVWGLPFQVAVTIHNRGDVDSGELRVRYLLAGPNGELTNALVLGDAMIDGLAAGASQSLVRELKLPSRLPFGVQLSAGEGRIVVMVDPENTGLESDELNNTAASGTVSIRLPTNRTPTNPVPTPTPSPTTPSPTTPTRRAPTQPSANVPGRQQRLQRAQDRRSQLQALRESLLQRRAQNRPQGGSNQPRRFALLPRQQTNLAIFPDA